MVPDILDSIHMKEKEMQALSAEELARYRTDGVIIPGKGLGADTVAELRVKLDSFLSEQRMG